MKKRLLSLCLAAVAIIVAALAVSKPNSVPIVAQLTHQYRPGHRMPSITTLPEFPGIPLYASLLSREKQLELIYGMVDHKISTWPVVSSRAFQ